MNSKKNVTSYYRDCGLLLNKLYILFYILSTSTENKINMKWDVIEIEIEMCFATAFASKHMAGLHISHDVSQVSHLVEVY